MNKIYSLTDDQVMLALDTANARMRTFLATGQAGLVAKGGSANIFSVFEQLAANAVGEYALTLAAGIPWSASTGVDGRFIPGQLPAQVGTRLGSISCHTAIGASPQLFVPQGARKEQWFVLCTFSGQNDVTFLGYAEGEEVILSQYAGVSDVTGQQGYVYTGNLRPIDQLISQIKLVNILTNPNLANERRDVMGQK